MENNGRGQQQTTVVTVPDSSVRVDADEVNVKIHAWMKLLRDKLDSPLMSLIVKNTLLTILELPGHNFNPEDAVSLLTDENYRKNMVDVLRSVTPTFWGNDWNSAWRKDAEPLHSYAQQEISRRNSLIKYWTVEWEQTPADAKAQAAMVFRGLKKNDK